MLKKLILAGAILFGCMSYAQVTTSNIRGQVTDENNEPLPGATVVAVHQPTGTQYGTVTNIDGRVNLLNLRIGGPYKITISYVGFQNFEQDNVFLDLGQTYNLEIQLKSSLEQLDEVVVTGGRNTTFNSDRTGAETNIGRKELSRLPTISRSAQDFYRLEPTATGNSFGGRNDQFNNFSLDGSIFNNPFGLDAATPGGQTNAQPVSLDAIEQIQVSLAPYDVTQAGFTGAGVNAVTKSGTNEFHGTTYFFYRDDNLTGDEVEGDKVFVPDLTQIQTGVSIGGPIIKNKVFFFANFELDDREDLGSNFLASRPGISGSNVSRVLASDLELVSSLLSGLGYQTGPFENFKHDTESTKGIFKIDWNINQNHRLAVIYNFLDASRDLPANPNAIGRRGPDQITLQFQNAGYEINNQIQSWQIELNSNFGNKFTNKFQAGFTRFDDFRNPFSTPAPVININKDGTRYIVAGHEPFSINNRLEQKVWQATNNFNAFLGKHTLTVGTSFEKFSFNNSFNLGAFDAPGFKGGTFGPGFDSVDEFQQAVNDGTIAAALAFAQNVADTNNANNTWALAETNVGQWAAYIQDEWNIARNFKLTYGLRFDLPIYFDTKEKIQENIDRKGGLLSEGGTYAPDIQYFDENGNPVFLNSLNLPAQKALWSPRLGFNWDVFDDKVFQIRGGTGIFSGRLPFVWIATKWPTPTFSSIQPQHPTLSFLRSGEPVWVLITNLKTALLQRPT